MCRRARCEFWCPTGGCMAEPGDAACSEARDAMEAEMRESTINWTDWKAALRELAEVEGFEIEDMTSFKKAWAAGKSPEEAIEEAEDL